MDYIFNRKTIVGENMLIRLIDDINRALENECFFAALALALTLPDTCGKAAYPDLDENRYSKKRYTDWCKEYVCKTEKPFSSFGDDMPYLNEEIIYQLRCSLLHQSTPNVSPERIHEECCKVDEFSLVITDESSVDSGTSMVSYGAGMKIVKRGYEVSIRHLCYILCASAKKYYEDNIESFDFINYHLVDDRKEES